MKEIKTVRPVRFERLPSLAPFLLVELDGVLARVHSEQKFRSYGGIFVRPYREEDEGAFEDHVFILPADPADGRLEPLRYTSVVVDPRLVRVFDRFFELVNNGSFREEPWAE